MCVCAVCVCAVYSYSNSMILGDNGSEPPTARARDFRSHAHSIYQPARALTHNRHKISLGGGGSACKPYM